MGDGEHEPPEILLGPLEAGKGPGHVDPGLRGQVLGFAGCLEPQVAEDRARKVLVELGHSPFLAGSRGEDHSCEVLPQSHASIVVSTGRPRSLRKEPATIVDSPSHRSSLWWAGQRGTVKKEELQCGTCC